MANKKISQLDAGTASLTSIIPASDAAGTVTNKVTVQSILNAETRWSALVPAAPTNVSTAADNAQASVSWTAPTSLLSITDYIVQYSSDSGSTWTTFSDGTSTSTSATVTGLTNGTAYTFRVAAVNGVGTGAYSTASSAVTPQATPGIVLSGSSTSGFNGVWPYAGQYNGRNYYSKETSLGVQYIYFVPLNQNGWGTPGWGIHSVLGQTGESALSYYVWYDTGTPNSSVPATPVFGQANQAPYIGFRAGNATSNWISTALES